MASSARAGSAWRGAPACSRARPSSPSARTLARGQDRACDLGEAGAALALGDVARLERQLVLEAADVGNAYAVREVLEHQHVVGGVADVDPALQFVLEVAAEQLADHPARARQLVVIAVPAVDVD